MLSDKTSPEVRKFKRAYNNFVGFNKIDEFLSISNQDK